MTLGKKRIPVGKKLGVIVVTPSAPHTDILVLIPVHPQGASYIMSAAAAQVHCQNTYHINTETYAIAAQQSSPTWLILSI